MPVAFLFFCGTGQAHSKLFVKVQRMKNSPDALEISPSKQENLVDNTDYFQLKEIKTG